MIRQAVLRLHCSSFSQSSTVVLTPQSMPPLQFQQLSSQPTPGFWSALTSVKLDKLKLADTRLTITGQLSEARQTVDREKAQAPADSAVSVDGAVGIDGVLSVDAEAFAEEAATQVLLSLPCLCRYCC